MVKIAFLDLEASSLNSGSYPIEVGWVDETGQGESYLIRPQRAWADWSIASQGIHGVSRETLLSEGKSAVAIARRASDALRDRLVLSDNPAFDQYWLGMLLAVGEQAPIVVTDLEVVVRSEVNRALLREGDRLATEAFNAATRGQRTKHRALPDAMQMWQRWQAVQQVIDRRLKAPMDNGRLPDF